MKACILLFAVLTAFSARSAQSETSPAGRATTWLSGGVTVKQTYPGMPWLDYSKLPWFKQPSTENSANPETLLANLKDDLEAAVSGLSTLTNSLVNESQNATEDSNVIAIADENFNGLASRDFSTLLSQDLSVQCGQLLSTSLAVPTSLPWCPWGNRPRTIVVGTPSGEMALPVYPPRTAWGNGPGVVVTTPGGAVFSMVPATSQTMTEKGLADSTALRDLNRQLLLVQSDVERLQASLKNLNSTPNRLGPPPAYQPYLSPTGR